MVNGYTIATQSTWHGTTKLIINLKDIATFTNKGLAILLDWWDINIQKNLHRYRKVNVTIFPRKSGMVPVNWLVPEKIKIQTKSEKSKLDNVVKNANRSTHLNQVTAKQLDFPL